MKRLLFLLLIFVLCLADFALGYEVMVVKSTKNQVNERVQQLFLEEFERGVPRRGTKTIQPHQLLELVVAKGSEEESVSKIESIQPDLILALGKRALKLSLSVPDIPIVHLLVIDPHKLTGDRRGVAGVSLAVPPKAQLDEMSRYLPTLKRVGLVYDPNRSAEMVAELSSIRPDLEFVALKAKDTASVPGLIQSLDGRVDLLWMLPDLTVTNRKTLESYTLFSIRNKVALLTFSEKLLKSGATMAVTFDLDGVAKQAAELAAKMLTEGIEQPVILPPLTKTILNQNMLKKLQISVESREGGDD